MGQRLGVTPFFDEVLADVHFEASTKIFAPVRQSHHKKQKKRRKTELQPRGIIPVFDERPARSAEAQASDLYGVVRSSDVSVAARADGFVDERHVRGRLPALFCFL